MIKLNMRGDEGFQVIRNYVQPVFKIEKINRNCVPSEAQLWYLINPNASLARLIVSLI